MKSADGLGSTNLPVSFKGTRKSSAQRGALVVQASFRYFYSIFSFAFHEVSNSRRLFLFHYFIILSWTVLFIEFSLLYSSFVIKTNKMETFDI